MADRIPSVKTLMSIKDVTREDAETIRDIMRRYVAVPCACGRLGTHRTADAYPYNVCSYYGDGKHRYSRMTAIDKILRTFGVEEIDAGRNKRSPAIRYCNTGDPYGTTIMFVRGRFVVGCWGDIVERGNYA